LSRLFDRLMNAARLRGRPGADHSLLAQALRRAAEERAQRRATNGSLASHPTPDSASTAASTAAANSDFASGSASRQSPGRKIDNEDWAKSLAAPDDVDARIVAAMREHANRDKGAPSMRPFRSRVARCIAGVLALVALVTLVVISWRFAQAPPAAVPVFQLDKTLR
jgi:hypothetical protein